MENIEKLVQKALEGIELLKHPGHPDQKVHDPRGGGARAGAYADFGQHGKRYIVGERGEYYLTSKKRPTQDDFDNPNLSGAIHKSDLKKVIRSSEE